MTSVKELRYIPSTELDGVVEKLPKCVIHEKVLKLLFTEQYKQRSDEWFKKRKSSLTASDAAAALDLNKHCTRSFLLRKKAGVLPKGEGEFQSTPATEHGIKYEDHAADIYMCNNPHLAPFFELGLIMHPVHPFLGASPDRVTKDGILIEIKVTPLFSRIVFSSCVKVILYASMQRFSFSLQQLSSRSKLCLTSKYQFPNRLLQ